jgi:signal transduction histidine kinase
VRPTLRFPLALGIGGAAVTVVSVVPILGQRVLNSYGSASPGAAVLEAATGIALLAAASIVAIDPRHRRTALATFGLGVVWFGAVWAGWPSAPPTLRDVGVLLVPLVPPAALLVVSTLAEGRSRLLGFAVSAVAAALGLALWLVRDPFLDRYCWRDCLAGGAPPFADVELARTLTNATLAAGVCCGVVIVVLCALGVRRRAAGLSLEWALWPGTVMGATLGLSSLALLAVPEESPDRDLFVALYVGRGFSLIAFAGGLATAVIVRRRYVRSQIALLAAEAADAPGISQLLADAFAEPGLRVVYPLADGSVVGADGASARVDETSVRVLRGTELVALIDTPGTPPSAAALDRELGAAGRLALANERLRAEQLARLRELTELRGRIVAAGDAERRRLERDLHDGAQQRLLALGFDLRVATAEAEATGDPELPERLRAALACVEKAGSELRAIAHGLFPATLASSGLVAAVESLADTRTIVLVSTLGQGQRFAPAVESAAYAALAEATDGAGAPVKVDIRESDDELLLAIDDAPWNGGVVSVEDRIGAVGGTIEWRGRRFEARLPAPRARA